VRLQRECGFHIHMHAFTHVRDRSHPDGLDLRAPPVGNGHSDYQVLQRYVRLATDRNFGPRKEWRGVHSSGGRALIAIRRRRRSRHLLGGPKVRSRAQTRAGV
jgi:hypothetical protein